MNKRPRKQKLIAEINITPFTDVILVLLVIFMITTPLILQSSIKVNLPEAASAEPTKGPNQIEITITNEGSVYLVNKLVTRKELRDKVYVLERDNPDLNVVLRSDRLVRFKDIVGVLDILTEFGIKKLNIAATAE
jgi:biopolymer transport protein ExbD